MSIRRSLTVPLAILILAAAGCSEDPNEPLPTRVGPGDIEGPYGPTMTIHQEGDELVIEAFTYSNLCTRVLDTVVDVVTDGGVIFVAPYVEEPLGTCFGTSVALRHVARVAPGAGTWAVRLVGMEPETLAQQIHEVQVTID